MTSEAQPPKSYEVGYRKPPKKNQFVKGKSGNPKGRPPKAQPVAPTDIREMLSEPVKVRMSGNTIEMPVFEASIRALAARAIRKSNLHAASKFIDLCKKYGLLTTSSYLLSPVVRVPRDWDSDEFLAKLRRDGPPPWPGERSGMPTRPDPQFAHLENHNQPSKPRKSRGWKSEVVHKVALEIHETPNDQGIQHVTTLGLMVNVVRQRACEGVPRAIDIFHQLQQDYGPPSREDMGLLLVLREKSTEEEWEREAYIQQAPYRGNNAPRNLEGRTADKPTGPGKIRTGHF